jgi:prolyl-tRNA editing enzyme YbaK/EbsC (Cys-tRNA(Pro) deacylase)
VVDRTHAGVSQVEDELRRRGVQPQVRWLDDAATTAAAAAAVLGTDVGAIANSLIFTLDGAPVLVLTSGAHRVDTAWLGERLGGRLRRADPDTVRSATGQAIGGVAPIGHPQQLPTWVDVDLQRHPVVWAAAGHAHTVFPITYADLVRVTGGSPTPVTPD